VHSSTQLLAPALLLIYDSASLATEVERRAPTTLDLRTRPLASFTETWEVERALLVECCSGALPSLPRLLEACVASGQALLGLQTRATDDATLKLFEPVCHAIVELEDNSLWRQLEQHLRWHARLSAQEDPLARRAHVSQRQIDRRVRHLRPYAEFFRNAAEAMIVTDDLGTILYTNPAARTLAGVASTEGVRNIFDYLAPLEADRARSLARLLATTAQVSPADFSIQTKHGARIVSVHASKMQRSPGAFLLTFRDVTQQREIERTLTHTKDFLQQVIDSSVDAIVSADLQGNILVFNRAAGRIFDYDPVEVVGKMNVRRLYPPGGAENTMQLIRSRERSGAGQLEGHQTQMLSRQGDIVPVRLSAAFVREGRSIVATVGVFTDIRHELALAEKLRQAEAELHETEKDVALAQLAGMTAHELNQPLTIILGYSELLQRVCTQPDARQTADVLASQAQRLAEIVRRIGRITRYETKGYVGGSAILDLERATSDTTKP
jgi:PAS domain S-box-containing protein